MSGSADVERSDRSYRSDRDERAAGWAGRSEQAERSVAGVVAVVLGVLVAGCATLLHRAEAAGLPAGLLAALATVLVGAVLARAVADGAGVFLYGLATLLTILLMTYYVPGGDLILTAEPVSYAWIVGAPVVAAAAMLTPRSWYADLPAVA